MKRPWQWQRGRWRCVEAQGQKKKGKKTPTFWRSFLFSSCADFFFSRQGLQRGGRESAQIIRRCPQKVVNYCLDNNASGFYDTEWTQSQTVVRRCLPTGSKTPLRALWALPAENRRIVFLLPSFIFVLRFSSAALAFSIILS